MELEYFFYQLRAGATLSELVSRVTLRHITTDYVAHFGPMSDGVIEYVGQTVSSGGTFETGYYHGTRFPKSIINVSAQVGCPSRCNFCELGSQRYTRNLTPEEISEQVILILDLARRRGIDIDSIPHKINIAKSGDWMFNPRIVETLELMSPLGFSFKPSTVFPSSKHGRETFSRLAEFASRYPKPVQIQISLISTSEEYRRKAAGIPVALFSEIADSLRLWAELNPLPKGRKPNLSLILTEGVPVDVDQIRNVLPPSLCNFRFRNYVPTDNGGLHGLETITAMRINRVKKSFAEAGYDVSDWATPSPTEWKFRLSSNSTLERYRLQTTGNR